MVRVKKEWMLHKNVVVPYKGESYYKCGALLIDMGDITDSQAISMPKCPQCFKEGDRLGMGIASARVGGDGEANAKRSVTSTRPKGDWL